MLSGDEAVEFVRRSESSSGGSSARQMPLYNCHKQVWALKINEVIDPTKPGEETDGSRILVPVEEGFGPFRVDREYVRKHNPQAGGYYVVYKDGYRSFSPSQAFEEGYTRA